MHQKLLGNSKKGLVFVLSGPAGTGKTTLVQMLVHEFPEVVVRSISYTTRKPRSGEVSGEHYHFIDNERFEQKIKDGEMLEFAKVYSHYYGTAFASVKELQEQGKHVILVIDTQGALQLKGKFPAVFIFLQPPSLDVLRMRLTQRQTENSAVIEERLAWAQMEMKVASEYDYNIENDDLQIAYQILRSIVIAEDHRIQK
jgi:guanylate kinase